MEAKIEALAQRVESALRHELRLEDVTDQTVWDRISIQNIGAQEWLKKVLKEAFSQDMEDARNFRWFV
jgi:hypothetical protein